MSRTNHSDWPAALAAAAGTVALFAVPWLLPLIGSVISFVSPLPLVLLYRLRGPRAGRLALLAAAVATLVVLQVAAPPGGGYYLFYFLVMAGALGEIPCLGLPERWGVAGGAAGGVLTVLFLLVVAAGISGVGPWELWRGQWRAEMTMVLDMYRSMNLAPATLKQIQDGLALAGRMVLHLAPGILVTASLLVAWMNMLVVRRLATRLGSRFPAEDFTLFRVPEPLVWVVIAGGGMMALGSGWLFWAGANLLVIMGMLYFFQGLAVIDFWLRTKRAPVLLRGALYLLVALELYVAVFLAALGLFDIWLNLRRRGMAKPPESEE